MNSLGTVRVLADARGLHVSSGLVDAANCLPWRACLLTSVAVKPKAYRISCIISTYADSAYVPKKIDEILRQSIFRDVEFIFVETGSPESERELIGPFADKFSNVRLLTTDDRRTLYQAWNMGWDAASADLVCYSNMDDALHPRCLEFVSNYMENNPDKDLCSVMIAYQYETSRGQRDSFDAERLGKLKISRRPGPFTAWRKHLKETIGVFDENYRVMGDLDFWSRANDAGLNIGIIYKVLYLYSVAPTQLSKGEELKQERNYSEVKGVRLNWLSGKEKLLLLHRKLFRFFPRAYLVAEEA